MSESESFNNDLQGECCSSIIMFVQIYNNNNNSNNHSNNNNNNNDEDDDNLSILTIYEKRTIRKNVWKKVLLIRKQIT